MKKRILSIITIMAMVVSMMVPTLAGNGDNTGDDIFGMSMYINTDVESGEYTLGDTFSFTAVAYVGDLYKKEATRNISITGPAEVSNFQYENDEKQWVDVAEFNVTETVYNLTGTKFQTEFTSDGTYKIEFKYTQDGVVCGSVAKYVTISEGSFELFDTDPAETPSETTSEEPPIDPVDPPTDPVDPPTDPVDPPTDPVDPPTDPVDPPTDPVDPPTDDTTTVVPPTDETTTVAPTTEAPTTKVKAPARTKVRYANKKKASRKIKLSIKRIKGARGYQVAVYKTLKNAKKNKKAIYKKHVRKSTVRISIKNKYKNSKKLYIKVRAYKLNGKKKVYAKQWSKVKGVKISK